jgi:DNA-binding FadR family transcriptional regulator
MHRLRPHNQAQGLTSLEAMVIVQIVSHKWDERAPFPALGTIAERLSVSRRTIRGALERLEDFGYVRREFSSTGGTNRYHFDGLVRALESLIAEDARKLAAAEAA